MEFKHNFHSRGNLSILRFLTGMFLIISTLYLLIFESYFSPGLGIVYLLVGLFLFIEGMGYKPLSIFGEKYLEIEKSGMRFKMSPFRKRIHFHPNEISSIKLIPGRIIIETNDKRKEIDITGLPPVLRHNIHMALLSFARENQIPHSTQGYLQKYE